MPDNYINFRKGCNILAIKITPRQAKKITNKEDLEYLLSMDEKKACKTSTIMECFGEFGDKRRFNPYDYFDVPPGAYGNGKKNKNGFTTTVGLWIFNKAFIEPNFTDTVGYCNDIVGKKKYGKINKKISQAVMEDRATIDSLRDFVLKTQKFQPYSTVLSPSISENMLGVSQVIDADRKKLFKEHEKELRVDKDPVVSQKIENILIKECKEKLKGDPALDTLDSGGGPNYGNNFKNMFIMKGASKEADPRVGDYAMMESNLMDGISAEEYADFCNSLTGGPYARAKKTADGGAWEKTFVKGLEHITVTPGTDCHTKRTKKITLTEDNAEMWMYSYIMENGKPIELTSENIDKYIGKTVNMRYSAFCESKTGICNICAGNLFTRLKMTNIGIACYNICSVIKNKSMKSFHDSTVKTDDMVKRGLKKIFGL